MTAPSPSPAMHPLPRAAGHTHSSLVGAACDVAARKGFRGLSVRVLCESVGIRESRIYNHFESKAELVLTRSEPAVSGFDEPGTLLDRFEDEGQVQLPTGAWPSASDLIAPLAALPSCCLVLGASQADLEFARTLAQQHAELWIRLHGRHAAQGTRSAGAGAYTIGGMA